MTVKHHAHSTETPHSTTKSKIKEQRSRTQNKGTQHTAHRQRQKKEHTSTQLLQHAGRSTIVVPQNQTPRTQHHDIKEQRRRLEDSKMRPGRGSIEAHRQGHRCGS